jgi:hypothetical protein
MYSVVEHARKRKYSKQWLFTVGTHLIEEESFGLLGGELEGDAGVPARGESYKVHQVKHEHFASEESRIQCLFDPWIRDPDLG